MVRERRHQQALTVSLPPPSPTADLRQKSPLPSPLSSDSPSFDSLSDLEKLAVIGHGNGSTIYKGQHRKTSSLYALKVFRFDEDAITLQQQAAREAEILRRVDSEFVVKCYGVFDNGTEDSDCSDRDICFIMEYMEVGSLSDFLRSHQRLSEPAISSVAKRVLKGLHYLHGLQIVHRDIKPSNLLINSKGEIKIADFGVSRVVVSGKQLDQAYESYVGTCAYMSPERFDPEKWDGHYSNGFAGDVWSLGLVVLECHVGHFPLVGPEQKPDWPTLMCMICYGERMEVPEADAVSPEFRSFVWRCLEKDWRKRGTVEELLSHPFVTKCGASDHSTGEFAGLVLEE